MTMEFYTSYYIQAYKALLEATNYPRDFSTRMLQAKARKLLVEATLTDVIPTHIFSLYKTVYSNNRTQFFQCFYSTTTPSKKYTLSNKLECAGEKCWDKKNRTQLISRFFGHKKKLLEIRVRVISQEHQAMREFRRLKNQFYLVKNYLYFSRMFSKFPHGGMTLSIYTWVRCHLKTNLWKSIRE